MPTYTVYGLVNDLGNGGIIVSGPRGGSVSGRGG